MNLDAFILPVVASGDSPRHGPLKLFGALVGELESVTRFQEFPPTPGRDLPSLPLTQLQSSKPLDCEIRNSHAVRLARLDSQD